MAFTEDARPGVCARCWWIAPLLWLCLSGCLYPIQVTPECRGRMSACLQDCAPGEGAPGPQNRPSGNFEGDGRSECERRCHAMCQHP